MRLTELRPFFLRYDERVCTWNEIVGPHETWRERGCPSQEVTGPRQFHVKVNTLGEAQGVMFVCPVCFQKKGDDIGVHSVNVTFADRGVPDHLGCHNTAGEPTRWVVSGTGFEDLTTKPSILLEGEGCGWHGYITNGDVT